MGSNHINTALHTGLKPSTVQHLLRIKTTYGEGEIDGKAPQNEHVGSIGTLYKGVQSSGFRA